MFEAGRTSGRPAVTAGAFGATAWDQESPHNPGYVAVQCPHWAALDSSVRVGFEKSS